MLKFNIPKNKIFKSKLIIESSDIITEDNLDLNSDTPVTNMIKDFLNKTINRDDITIPPSLEARVTAIEEAITDIILSQMEV